MLIYTYLNLRTDFYLPLFSIIQLFHIHLQNFDQGVIVQLPPFFVLFLICDVIYILDSAWKYIYLYFWIIHTKIPCSRPPCWWVA